MTLTKNEYLALVTRFVEEQYGNEIDKEEQAVRPSFKKNNKEPVTPSINTVINATDYKKDQIEDAVLYAANLRIGKFLIKIYKHNYNPESEDGMPMTYDLNLYEESPYVYLNRPSKKVTKITPSKDSRFDTRPWVSFFSANHDKAEDMTLDGLLEMTRWLQAVGKMAAFL